MTDERLDLHALDPDADGGAEGRFVNAVMAGIAGRTPAGLPMDPLVGVWSMMRNPALAAGIILAAAIGVAALTTLRADDGAPATVAQALGVPPEFLAMADRDGR